MAFVDHSVSSEGVLGEFLFQLVSAGDQRQEVFHSNQSFPGGPCIAAFDDRLSENTPLPGDERFDLLDLPARRA